MDYPFKLDDSYSEAIYFGYNNLIMINKMKIFL